MQDYFAVGSRFNSILAIQHIEIWPAYRYVFIQSCRRNRFRVGLDAKGQFFVQLPFVYRFDKEDSVFKRSVSDAADSFLRQGSFDRSGKTDSVKEAGSLLFRFDFADPFNVLPDGMWLGVDRDLGLHRAHRLWQRQSSFDCGRS